MASPTSPGLGNREAHVARLAEEPFDALIVGGGITGAGIALELSARGLRIALVERHDFASGTSSRSSKLIHGGLRYLAQLQFDVTRESLEERRRLEVLAPALVERLPFIIAVAGGLLEAARIAVGLTLYGLLGGSNGGIGFAPIRRVDLARLAPGLNTAGMTSAYVYHDCRTDDARLVLAVLRQAARRGASLTNHLEATELLQENGRAVGLRCLDRLAERTLEVRARAIVLATGAWGDRSLGGGHAPAQVRPSKGVHLVLPSERLPVRTALYLPTGVDERLVFVVPWHDRVLVGTTDTDYQGPLDAPAVEQADVDYLLGVLNRAFPSGRFTECDVVGAQAGIRPLVDDSAASPTEASREERISERPDGVVVVSGGKLTTYRLTAEKVAAVLRERLGLADASPTRAIAIAPLIRVPALAARLRKLGVDDEAADRLIRLYGPDLAALIEILERDPGLAQPLVPGGAPLRGETAYAARYEHARAIGDVLARRTRLLLLDHRGARAAAGDVADLLGAELGWSAAAGRRALADFEAEAAQYRLPDQNEPAAAPRRRATR